MLGDDVLGRAGDEVVVAEFGLDLGDFELHLVDLPVETRLLRRRDRRRRRAAARPSRRARRAAARPAARPPRFRSTRRGRAARCSRSRRARFCAARSLGATRTSGVWVDGGTPISDLTDRISAMRSTTQPISASTASSTSKPSAGQGPSASGPARSGPASPLIAQSSSVRNGMNGMQDRVDHVEHMGDRRLRLGLGRRVGARPAARASRVRDASRRRRSRRSDRPRWRRR